MAKIMIVDDSDIMRISIRNILSNAGHEIVTEAKTGNQAILAYKIYRPDIVTMDINMPGINGIIVLREILNEFPNAKIIMITALDQRLTVYEALKNGAVNYILKPIEADKVLTVVKDVLNQNKVSEE